MNVISLLLVAIDNKPDPILIVDGPLAGSLVSGKAFIQYRAVNMRIMQVFGAGAMGASPLLGHIHVTVDAALGT